MIMKVTYGFLLALFFVTIPVYAQAQPSGDDRQPPSAAEIVAKMQAKLNLTQDQVTAITPIIEKYSSKREELRQNMEDGTADRDSMKSQMKDLRVQEKQELSQILSSDQLAQLAQMFAQGRHKPNSDGGSAGTPGSGGDNSQQ